MRQFLLQEILKRGILMDNLFVAPSIEDTLIWNGGAELIKDLDHFIKQPILHPELVDPVLNPFHHMMAVYGRKGMGKARGISNYCKSINVRHAIIDVEFGKTWQARELIEGAFQNIAANPPPMGTFDVLIIDHADLMILNPDTELTMQLMLELKTEAANHRCMIFACFDRNPLRQTQSAVPENTKQFRSRVMAQFTVNFYFAHPTSTFRCDLIRSLLDHAQERYAPHLKVELSETDYVHMETYTSFCSPLEIINYVRAILNSALSENRVHPASFKEDKSLYINLEVMRFALSSATGSLHVLRFDPKIEEDEYCRLCGKGTIPGVSKKLAPAPTLMKKDPKVVKEGGVVELEEEEEEEEKNTASSRKRFRRQKEMKEEERILKAFRGEEKK